MMMRFSFAAGGAKDNVRSNQSEQILRQIFVRTPIAVTFHYFGLSPVEKVQEADDTGSGLGYRYFAVGISPHLDSFAKKALQSFFIRSFSVPGHVPRLLILR